jgi:hypothetical protein
MTETTDKPIERTCFLNCDVEQTRSLIVLLRDLQIEMGDSKQVPDIMRLLQVLTTLLENNTFSKADWGNFEIRDYIEYCFTEMEDLYDVFQRMWSCWEAKLKMFSVAKRDGAEELKDANN